MLADLHVHLYGCIRAIDMLGRLKTCETVDWGWYEEAYEAAYGFPPATRQLVETYRAGDESVVGAFTDLFAVGDALIATDNPGIFDTRLVKEIDWVCRHTGGGEDLRRIDHRGMGARAERLSGRVST